MGFESDETAPCLVEVHRNDPRYASKDEAESYAMGVYSEYGWVEAKWCVGGRHETGCLAGDGTGGSF